MDVPNSLIAKGNRYLNDNSFDSLYGGTLPDSMFSDRAASVARGVTWGSLPFPPYDAVTPTTPQANGTDIPAGYRFVNGSDPGESPVAPSNAVIPSVGGSATVGGTMTFTLGFLVRGAR